jgi:hypothetical protein
MKEILVKDVLGSGRVCLGWGDWDSVF